jgi:SSS family solute:Na+ symporter
MIERNQAEAGPWREFVASNAERMAGTETYNRLSVIQPITHETHPWPSLIFTIFSISIWYNVINQFMIQRVLGAKNMYHARMGIVLAGYMKVLMPALVVIPGLILFAHSTESLAWNWDDLKAKADQGYVQMLQMLIPVGLRGLFLAALFGAIQSTVNSVLNSTATVFTLDIYKRLISPGSSEKHLVRMGMWSSVVILIIAILLAGYIQHFKGSLFVYIQALYAFFAPPFSAVFLLGILWRRINGPGAIVAVSAGFVVGVLLKIYEVSDNPLPWLKPYAMQSIVNWGFCTLVCIVVSLLTRPPAPEQVTDELTFNWRKLNILQGLGGHWYSSVVLWWIIFVLMIAGLMLLFSGVWL